MMGQILDIVQIQRLWPLPAVISYHDYRDQLACSLSWWHNFLNRAVWKWIAIRHDHKRIMHEKTCGLQLEEIIVRRPRHSMTIDLNVSLVFGWCHTSIPIGVWIACRASKRDGKTVVRSERHEQYRLGHCLEHRLGRMICWLICRTSVRSWEFCFFCSVKSSRRLR